MLLFMEYKTLFTPVEKILTSVWKNLYTQCADPETQIRLYINRCILMCFTLGLTYDLYVYLHTGRPFLAVLNAGSLLIYAAIWLIEIKRPGKREKILAAPLFTAQLNIAITLLYNSLLPHTLYITAHDLFIGFLVCILASLTLPRKSVYLLCLVPIAVWGYIVFRHDYPALQAHYPSLVLAYIAPPLLLLYCRVMFWKTFRTKEQLFREKKYLCRAMGMTEQQWEQLIDVIRTPRPPREQTEYLFKQLQSLVNEQLTIRAKRLLADEQTLYRISQEKHLRLTSKEIRLCRLIIEEKSISDISTLLYISESGVRAARHRIRRKFGITPQTDLKWYLEKLIHDDAKQNK